MKLILLEDVKGTGKKNEVVNVKDGFALNFLIPNKKAVKANNENLEKLKLEKEDRKKKKEKQKENSKKIAEKLKDIKLEIKTKVGEDGRLFGTITSRDIEENLLEQENIKIDKKRITIPEKIKVEGNYLVDIKLEEGVDAKLKIIVKGE